MLEAKGFCHHWEGQKRKGTFTQMQEGKEGSKFSQAKSTELDPFPQPPCYIQILHPLLFIKISSTFSKQTINIKNMVCMSF